ncbi:hypothetical protein Clacol_001366 [Clathrus columnatus]|uniref:F-box domain-containing protein n=1 Tax=Clathrus columnatus TaxID=1419009 RepID=A0AAV5A2C1_9AGAM|nr:hypothetical protein Clacol_001366 [Clathrus columnatus]
MIHTLETLPVELVAEILSELDLSTLITVSCLSRRLRTILSDASLNPWRKPMLHGLTYVPPPPSTSVTEDSSTNTSLKNLYPNIDPALFNLSVRNMVPKQNWIEVFARAPPEWILYESTIPNLRDSEWEECFKRRFLPGWKKRKTDGRWRVAFTSKKTRCTADEAWTSYIVLHRNGVANRLQATSRNFNPIILFNEIKMQNDLVHLDTLVRVLVQFADVRILAFGVQHKPRKSFQINPNAAALLRGPPAFESELIHPEADLSPAVSPIVQTGNETAESESFNDKRTATLQWQPLRHPRPVDGFANYPNFTPGGQDRRRIITPDGLEESGCVWVGSLMLVAQLINPIYVSDSEEGLELVMGPGHFQYASLSWADLWAIAPWMVDKITKLIEGPGLGIE